MCSPMLLPLAIGAAGYSGYTAVKKVGDVLSPKIPEAPKPQPAENVAASAANAAQTERRKALLARGQRSTILTGYQGARSIPQPKTLLGQ